MPQRVTPGIGAYDPLPEILEYRFKRQQLVRLVIDNEDARASVWIAHRLYLASILSMQPQPQQPKKLLRINRFGNVIRCARLNALLAIPFHRLGGQRDN